MTCIKSERHDINDVPFDVEVWSSPATQVTVLGIYWCEKDRSKLYIDVEVPSPDEERCLMSKERLVRQLIRKAVSS